MMKRAFYISLKALVCGILFFVGTILGGILANGMGLSTPTMPEGSDPARLALVLLFASLGMGGLLVFLAGRLPGSAWRRGLILALFGWVIYSLSNNLEAAIYTTFDSASPYKLVMDAAAFLLSGTAAALLVPPPQYRMNFETLSRWPAASWAWRLIAVWAAFPIVYLSFGKLVEPFVIEVYRQGQFEMVAPGWGQILPMQFLRSALFLAVCLPFVFGWKTSKKRLWVSLTVAFFLLVGGFYMLQAYWFPVGFRLLHSLEIFADSLAYTGCLVWLLIPSGVGRESISNVSAPRVGSI